MTQLNGAIKYANAEKRFGFITPDSDQPAVYFAFDQLRGSATRTPRTGEPVVYEVGTGARGPIATTVYNMADPLACEDYEADQDTAARLQATRQAAQSAQATFKAQLIEKNRQWHAARNGSADTSADDDKFAYAEDMKSEASGIFY